MGAQNINKEIPGESPASASMNPLIVETDIGRDPDDFFALLYLVNVGREIAGITVSPGDPDQIAFVRWALSEIGLDNIPIGTARDPKQRRESLSGPHRRMLLRAGFPQTSEPDDVGEAIIAAQIDRCPQTDIFICGPPKSYGRYLRNGGIRTPQTQIWMQGGFVGYGVHNIDVHRLDKFEGKITCPTFNLGGDKAGSEALLQQSPVVFVGKNLCHTLTYTREKHNHLVRDSKIYQLFGREMDHYMAEHDEKVMHDVVAAVMMQHPEIGHYFEGELYREKGEYGARSCTPHRHRVAIDVDRERLWDHILKGI